MNGYSTLLHNIAPGKYIVIKFEYGLQLLFKLFLNKSDRRNNKKIIIKMLMILDFKILSLWFVIKDWWYNTITRENYWFLNVLLKSNFATPTPFGSISCFVLGICLSNYNLNSFLIHQASYSKEYNRYLMHRENLGSIWKIGRYPIKVSEVLWSFVWFGSLCPSQQFFSSVVTGLPGLNQYYVRINVSLILKDTIWHIYPRLVLVQ